MSTNTSYGGDEELQKKWMAGQKRTFTRWANNFLQARKLKINDLESDLADGINLINLVEILTNKSIGIKYKTAPKNKAAKLENICFALDFVQKNGVRLVGIGGSDIYDQNIKLILGMIWTFILKFHIQRDGAGLEQWVTEQLAKYGLKSRNYANDWSNGQLLTALVDSLDPGSLPLTKYNPNEPLAEIEKAMDLAERQFEIPRILDAQDLFEIPDDLSTMTYVSYFYQYYLRRMSQPGRACAKHSFAEGPGLLNSSSFATRGANTKTFYITAVDFSKKIVHKGGDPFSANLAKASEPAKPIISCSVKDIGNGTYRVDYQITDPGDYLIDVLLDGEKIAGSPFPVRFWASPDEFSVSGSGVKAGKACETLEVIIQSREGAKENGLKKGDPFCVFARDQREGKIPVVLVEDEDGLQKFTFTPKHSGFLTVDVMLNFVPLAGSPFSFLVI
eukprot:TRINITY_DN13370_c0_g1_i1.p1 TRINITY_DN13370_c0_g1~~TRINITY_DN13370_c0_g1_i1.p1  ORF type:complete len:447 (+),score=95.94 TRINITY_DN13370_c0_g1_i1:36-1376(+)